MSAQPKRENCPTCHGRGSWEEPGDGHRSAGTVKCQACGGSGKVVIKPPPDPEARPKWDLEIPEELARWLLGHAVNEIEHRSEMTSADTSDDWLLLWCKSYDGKRQEAKRVPTSFFEVQSLIKFRPNHAGLIGLDPKIEVKIRGIDAWEKRNTRERSEYERLRRKFES